MKAGKLVYNYKLDKGYPIFGYFLSDDKMAIELEGSSEGVGIFFTDMNGKRDEPKTTWGVWYAIVSPDNNYLAVRGGTDMTLIVYPLEDFKPNREKMITIKTKRRVQ